MTVSPPHDGGAAMREAWNAYHSAYWQAIERRRRQWAPVITEAMRLAYDFEQRPRKDGTA